MVSCSPGHSCLGTQGVKKGPWVPELGACSLQDGFLEISIPPEEFISICHCRASAAFLSTSLILETWKLSGLLMCLLVVKHISLVYQLPRGSLLLIIPAPISLPILINLCQVKQQFTCQINDWISPAFPWAFSMKGYHLPWLDYWGGLGYCG